MKRIAIHGAALTIVASSIVIVLLYMNPRLFLQHYPQEIQQLAAPKTAEEQRLTNGLGVVFIGLLAGAPLWSTLSLVGARRQRQPYRVLFLNAFGIVSVFNLFDWLILDWLWMCTFPPRWAAIPGTEDVLVTPNYFDHFLGFISGTVLAVIIGLAAATSAMFVQGRRSGPVAVQSG